MVESITSTPMQPIETADCPEPGFEQVIDRALQEAAVDTSAKPAPSPKKTSPTETARPSKDSKTAEVSTVVVPIPILATVPVLQPPLETSPHFESAPGSAAAAIEQPSTMLCPVESSLNVQTIQVELVAATAIAGQHILANEEAPDSPQSQLTPQSEFPEDQHLTKQENQSLSATTTEVPHVASNPQRASDPLVKPFSPTKVLDSILANEGRTKSEDRPQNKDATPVEQPAPSAVDAPTSQTQTDRAPSPGPTVSHQTASKTSSDSPQTPKPTPARQVHNSALTGASSSREDNANPHSVSVTEAEAQPHQHLQHELIHNTELSNPVDGASKQSMPAGSSVLVPTEPKVPLTEPAMPTNPPDRAKPPELQLSDPPVPGAVHLLSQPARQEMKFSWNTLDFGHIEIRTTVDHDRVGALVAAPDATLRESLRSEIDSLTRALGQHSLELGDFHTSDSGTNANSRHSHDSNAGDKIPNYRPYGSMIHAPAPYRRDALHAGMVDLHA